MEPAAQQAVPAVPCGLLVVDKPLKWTSMDVVAKVRSAVRHGLPPEGRYVAGRRRKIKVGHAGTLDPLATGVVIVCVGKATKIVEKLMGTAKAYEATIDLSAFTASDDAEHDRQEVAVAVPPTRQQIDAALRQQVGLVAQVPPIFSAVHVEGQRAYKAARAGQAVELKAKTVRIDAIDVLRYTWPELEVRIRCGRGTYIRSIARDLGQALGTGGYLTQLRRTAVGSYTVEQALEIDRFEQPVRQEDLLPLPE